MATNNNGRGRTDTNDSGRGRPSQENYRDAPSRPKTEERGNIRNPNTVTNRGPATDPPPRPKR